MVAWDTENKSEMFLSRGVRLFVTIPDLGWLMLLVFAAVAAPLVLYIAGADQEKRELSVDSEPRRIHQHSVAGAGAGFLLAARAATEVILRSMPRDCYATSLAASPFIFSALVGGIFANLLYLLLLWRREDLERLLPDADALDRITYKTICIAFPLLTLMIAAGAYWANRTWGSYWNWDPKETWAAITWLVYAGYLHMRITRGWRGRRAAYFAILGFAVVMFTFFGVTYLLPGLHAYA